MSIIKEFNNKLNMSLENRSTFGLSFKEKIDVVLKSTIQRNKRFNQALVIGAGRMDDFSLSFFMKNFGRVFVTDVDYHTIQQSVETLQLPKSDRQKIVLKEVEYTGFEKISFFEDFRSNIQTYQSYDEIDGFLYNKFDQLKDFTFLSENMGKFDFIYVSPIYTQLVYNQVLLECSLLRESGYPENLIKYIEHLMLDEMVCIIERFNKNIFALLREEGTLFVLSDIFEVEVGSDFSRRVHLGIKNSALMDELYEDYRQKYGMGLGDFGLFNLDEMLSSHKHMWFIWPYKKDKELIIKLKIYYKNSKHKEVHL